MASTTTSTTTTTATETVAIHTFPETGRGLQAQLDIKEDAIILSAKWEAVWSVEAALNEPVLGDILNQNKLSVDDTLALFLLFVKLSPKCSRDQNDQRRVHVKSGIPESYTASCFFTDEDLEIAQGSSLYNLTIHSQSQIEDDFRVLLQRVFLRNPDVFPLGRFTLDEYKWALFTVWSRAMDFNVSAETSLRGVVPFLDMVNHSFDVKQCHAYDPTEKAVKILAGKSYKKGDEVFINYGPVSNTKLLRLYGFVVPGNPYNAFELVLSTSEHAPFFAEKAQVYASAGIPLDATFKLTLKDPLPTQVLQYLRIQRLTWTELNLAKSATGMSPFTARNEQEILETLIEAFESMLAGFSVKQDQLLAWVELGKWEKGSNAWMAAIVSLEEQQILSKSLAEANRLRSGIVCGHCGAADLTLKKCGKCNAIAYCDSVCQKANWGVHKVLCGAK
ncbi:hypothetical protein HDU79_011414 [Rhizoclosmatium sp. JEL0117]|nr:hypothetical protein HDU79_011414 [Rhizoclosmatium sp. JEL0117]